MTRLRAGIIYTFFISVIGLFFAGSLHAVEDTFKVTAQVGSDSTAPTVPGGVTATPVSASQIDLSWNASTDNLAVQGYRIYRDGAIIATTTFTTYSDIGLFSSTEYSYEIDAFDALLNFSARSATVTAITHAEASSDNDRRRSSSRRVEQGTVLDIRVITQPESAILIWDTPTYARANVHWGRTQDYELGVVSGVIYQKHHVVKIENLVPGTEYFYQVVLETNEGEVSIHTGSFTTDRDVFARPPESIVLVAEAADEAIVLTWNNQASQNVRLVRSDIFFPVDPYDGKIIYQGARDSEYVDKAVEEGKTYYYALFVIDENEMYSAPSIAKATLGSGDEPIFSDVSYSSAYESILKDLSLTDFDFIQKGEELSFSVGGLKLAPNASTEILVDAELIPLGIKAISITFIPTMSQDDSITFLLTYSKDRDKYVGMIPAVKAGETYKVEINLFNSHNEKVKTLQMAAYSDAHFKSVEEPHFIWQVISFVYEHFFIAFILILVGFVIGLMVRRL